MHSLFSKSHHHGVSTVGIGDNGSHLIGGLEVTISTFPPSWKSRSLQSKDLWLQSHTIAISYSRYWLTAFDLDTSRNTKVHARGMLAAERSVRTNVRDHAKHGTVGYKAVFHDEPILHNEKSQKKKKKKRGHGRSPDHDVYSKRKEGFPENAVKRFHHAGATVCAIVHGPSRTNLQQLILHDGKFMSGHFNQPVSVRLCLLHRSPCRALATKLRRVLDQGSNSALRLGLSTRIVRSYQVAELCGAVFAPFHPGDDNVGVCWQRKSAPFYVGRSNVR